MFTVDGIRWPWPCDISRMAEVKSSRISGLMLDRSYFNDVLGTYMAYTVNVAVPVSRQGDYDRLYEALTSPVEGHAFVLPYGQGEIAFVGRVESVSDSWVRGGWRGVKFSVYANRPVRALTLQEAIESRGQA